LPLSRLLDGVLLPEDESDGGQDAREHRAWDGAGAGAGTSRGPEGVHNWPRGGKDEAGGWFRIDAVGDLAGYDTSVERLGEGRGRGIGAVRAIVSIVEVGNEGQSEQAEPLSSEEKDMNHQDQGVSLDRPAGGSTQEVYLVHSSATRKEAGGDDRVEADAGAVPRDTVERLGDSASESIELTVVSLVAELSGGPPGSVDSPSSEASKHGVQIEVALVPHPDDLAAASTGAVAARISGR